MATTDTPKAVLYISKGSLWASVPRLALIEKGYTADECIIKEVDLLSGANFSQEYLRLNPKGTVPTLVVPHLQTVGSQTSTKYTALTDSIPIVEFLDSQRSATSTNATSPRSENAPNTAPAPSLGAASFEGKVILDEIIALVHSDEADANLLLLSARNADEIKAKALPAKFLAGRTKALTTYLEEAKKSGESERMVNFLSEKLKANKQLESFYQNPESAGPWFERSKKAWADLAAVLPKLELLLTKEERSGFINVADLHVGAWLARVLVCCGAKDAKDIDGSFAALRKNVGPKVDELTHLKSWWQTMIRRKSFQEVYGDGLH